MEATLYKTSGEETEVSPEGGTFTLDELQKFVGGYIELVPLPEGMVLVVNEEGLLRSLPKNDTASFLAGRIIVGDAVWMDASLIE